MLTNLIQEHDKIKRKTQKECEQKWQDLKKMSKGVTTHLLTSITGGVNVVFQNQRHLETEVSKLQTQIGKFYKEADQWKDLIKRINEPLKELGDVENWMRTIDQDLKDLVFCVNFVNVHQTEKENEQKKQQEIEEKRRLKLQEEELADKKKKEEEEKLMKEKEEKLMKEKEKEEQKQKKSTGKETTPKKKQSKSSSKVKSTSNKKTKKKKERSKRNKSEKSQPEKKPQKKKKLSSLELENELLKKKIEEMKKQMVMNNETEQN
ncbi:bloc-1 complex subunit 1 [Anaeramoeba flamelloides]|uniref:Biogenesis of lysosome-related organelles complex 1 subunit 1 n=1 Tax=Anaeramoeba flamelloides TaxID=1746091 RepID=A0ABQ8XDC7_9EUKA|nr:bloc-1 complex subunit 1 [Anaeramoeba flamelloides]